MLCEWVYIFMEWALQLDDEKVKKQYSYPNVTKLSLYFKISYPATSTCQHIYASAIIIQLLNRHVHVRARSLA